MTYTVVVISAAGENFWGFRCRFRVSPPCYAPFNNKGGGTRGTLLMSGQTETTMPFLQTIVANY